MFVILIITIMILSGGFGFIRNIDFLAINTPLGTFEFGQTLLIVLLIGLFFTNRKNDIKLYDKLISPFYLIILIIILQFFRNMFEGYTLREIIRNVKDGPFAFFIFFPMIYYIHSQDKINKYVQWLLYIGVISAIIAMLQFIFKIQFDFSTTIEFQPGVYRIYHPGALFFPFCIYIITSLLFDKNHRGSLVKNLISLCCLFGGMFSTLHRSLIISTISLFLILIIYYSFSKKNIKITFLFGLLSFFVTIYILYNAPLLDVFFARFETAYTDVKYFEGNYYGRFLLFYTTLTAVTKISLFFGAGFIYSSSYGSNLFVTSDNTYANLILISGIIGTSVFLFIEIFLITKSYRLSQKIDNHFYKILLLVIAIYNGQLLILGMFADIITYVPHIIYLIISWSLYILIKYQKRNYAFKISPNINSNTII